MNHFPKKSAPVFTLLFLLLSCTAFAQRDQVPSISKSFSLHGPGNLEVSTSGGGITVEGHDGSEVEVLVFVRKNGSAIAPSDPFLSEMRSSYELIIEKNGNTVVASARRIDKGKSWNNVSIAFHVNVPHRMSCSLRTSGGGLSLSAVEGTQSLNTSGGGIKLTDIKGSTTAHTSGGGIQVSGQEGDLEIHTSGGGITVEDAWGNIDGRTSGGGIRLNNIHGEIDVRTSGGGITITGDAGYVKASTSGGNIRVDINQLSKGIFLSTSGGGIHANIPNGGGMDLNLKAGKVNIDLQNFTGSAEKGSIVGRMNGGGIPVEMHSSGGNIDINF
jgi:hypothetical protein